jgi:hypothetical protein
MTSPVCTTGPYKICEHTLDEYVHHTCSLTRYGGNSGSFTDEEIERSRNSGKDDIVEYAVSPVLEPLENFEATRARWHTKRIEEAPDSNLPDLRNGAS